MIDDPIITSTDVILGGHCATGMRAWFEAVGLKDRFREFLKQGLPASVINDTDEIGRQVVRRKLEREARSDG